MVEISCMFGTDGAQLFQGHAALWITELEGVLANFPIEEAGTRIQGNAALASWLEMSGIGTIAEMAIGSPAKPVRALLFNKTAEINWGLGWHQDRTICVKEKREVEGFGPWTVKRGMNHVAPPFEMLAQMVTLRVHLDDVPEMNAPLLIAPGSHRLGCVGVNEIAGAVERCGVRACLAKAGDVWLYSTPILHASAASEVPQRRRVLQIDYAAFDLPCELEWLGI